MRYISTILLIITTSIAFSQVDDEFWFAPPLGVEYEDDGTPAGIEDIEIVITAMQATRVTIEKPATGWSYTTPLIGQFSSLRLNLGTDLGLNLSDIVTPPQELPLTGTFIPYNNGLLITSEPGLITVSYKLMYDKSQDQISLKGKNAIGTEFFVSTQNAWPNQDNNHFNGFTMVATADNTTIEIYRNDVWGNNPGAPAGPYPIIETVTLNSGQTFTVRSEDELVGNHINGVYVTSDNNIAITYWDDQVAKNLTNATNYKYDFAGDQLVPTSIIGQDYLVMKGGMWEVPPPGDGGERVFITGTADGTTVELYDLNGGLLETFVINSGEVINREVIVESTYIKSDAPIYVNHYTSVPTGKAVAASVLPPVGVCTGSHDVVITRSDHAGDVFLLNILAVNDTVPTSSYYNTAADGFYITTDEGVTHIPSNYFLYSPDSAYIVLDKVNFQVDFLGNDPVIDVGQTALIQNRNAKFHLGVLEGHKNQGSKYGYFSDYGGESARAGIGGPNESGLDVLCNLNALRLVALGGRTYTWSVVGDEANSLDYLSALDISDPIYYPDTFTTRQFRVQMTQLCGGAFEKILTVITLPQPTAYFTTEADEVCSPDSILITHGVVNDNVDLSWYYNSTTVGRTENTTTAAPYYYPLPDNTSDTLVSFQITLQANYLGACSDEYVKNIIVKPGVNSDFEFLGDSISCHPLNVELKNNSSGHVDSSSYFWNFGDNTISYEFDSVQHTYLNYTTEPDTLEIQLITRSPFDCMDTASADVIVFPRVKALFSTTPNQGCSPLIFDVNPINTVGADTLLWNIDYSYGDSSFKKLDLSSYTVSHEDTTISSGPDSLYVSLTAKNDYGCSDTALPHMLIAYPPAIAEFDINESVICDGDTIIFDNNSIGYNLDFYWNLGDGTAPNDSTPAIKPYFNPSSADVDYNINLTVISSNNCIDSKDTILTVHPYIDANFGINYVKNCSPLNVNITDNAFRAHIYNWDLGDGTVYNNPGNFTHTYINNLPNSDTTFAIKLIVSNNEGCSDSITRVLSVKPQVVASLGLINNKGCSPLDVSFQNLSQGGSYYVWNLGGNNLRTDTTIVDFSEQYSNNTAFDNFYPISLTAMNTSGCDSTVYDTVAVFANIFSSFTFEKDSSCSPFIPVLTNNSAAGAQVFEWYRDGAFLSSDKTPVLPIYENIGDSPDSYEFTLIAYGANDADHLQCADTHSLNLRVFPELHTSFTLGELASCQPLNTLITNNSNLQDSSQFIWYLDNYIYSTQDSPGNLFINNYSNNDVSHSLLLNGTTNHGCTDTISTVVDVYAYIDANFTIDKPSICSGDSFLINSYNTRGAIDTYLWDFDGSTSNRSDVQFGYSFDNITAAPDIKTITLTVSNANCDSTWVSSIQVNPLVTANFDALVDSGCHPHTTEFNNLTQNADYYQWTFGDGVSSTNFTPTHTFNNFDPQNNKSFDIRLIAESEYRCRDTAFGKITSYARPIANFLLPISVSCPPFNLSVLNNSEGPGVLSNLWDLGGTSSTEFEPTQIFDNTTSSIQYKTIKLLTTSENSCEDSTSQEITIYPRINVDFTTNPPAGCSPLQVDFIGDTLNVQQMVWYVDNKLFSAQVSPSNQFLNETGQDITHDIKFVAYSRYNCVDSSKGVVTVYPTPSSDFVANPIPAQYDTINDQTILSINNLTNHNSSWNYNWDFGDGNTDMNSQSSFNYIYGDHFWGPNEANNKVPIRLISTNKTHSECRDTLFRDVMILPPIPLVEIGDEIEGCIPLTVDFTSFSKYAYSDSYEWNFGDGSDIVSNENPTHIFNKAGTYTVKLNVEGDGGPAADYKLITVYPQPITDFSFNDTVVFVASQTKDDDRVNFYNQTKYGLRYEWFFDSEDFYSGNLPDSEEKDPVWAYDEIGVYYPVLVSYSTEGCSDTLIHNNYIRVLGEGVLVFPNGFFVDPGGAPADEYNTSQITPNMYVFYPKNNGVSKYTLAVYNRWGTLVFESDDVNRGWNGYIEGNIAKQDVYIWRAKGNFTNGQPFDMSGDVTLFHTPVNTNP